jgi:hypothetical protein
MKWRMLFPLMVATGAFAASDGAVKPAERLRLTAEMRRRASEGDSASSTQAGASTSRDDVVVMSPVLVTSFHVLSDGSREEGRPRNQSFAFKEGGTILKREGPRFTTELKFQYNAKHRGWDILSISW